MSQTMLYVLLSLLILLILCILVVCVDTNRFVIRSYRIENAKIRGEHRYVFLSDLHNKMYGKNHARLIEAIEKICPEAVFIGGDLLIATPGRNFDSAVSLVRALTERGYPVYYA
ncbi:MAG: hypothetical protein J6P60_05420, partial [Lachnospiraceae bacterium]|nr:hypothetical protein [Lachnospiraceae bacterium]